jgi:hypothetical protein
MAFLKVDYSKTEQPIEQKVCNHVPVVLEDMELVDGNYPNRKSTLLTGSCEICGYTETVEI